KCYGRSGGVARFNGNIIRTARKPGNIFGKLRLWICGLICIRKLIVSRLIVLILQGSAEGIQWYIREVDNIINFPDAATVFDEKGTLLHLYSRTNAKRNIGDHVPVGLHRGVVGT